MATGDAQLMAGHEIVESFSDCMTLQSPTSPIVQSLAAAVRDGQEQPMSSWSIRYQDNKAIGEYVLSHSAYPSTIHIMVLIVYPGVKSWLS